jgi:ribulose kinase
VFLLVFKIIYNFYREGQAIRVATICGGLSKSELFVQTHCDVLGIPVVRPEQTESVLLGAAMLGAAAASDQGDFLIGFPHSTYILPPALKSVFTQLFLPSTYFIP